MHQAGGGYDCEVLLNVPDTYEFLLCDLEDSYVQPNDEELESDEHLSQGPSLIPCNWSPVKCQKLQYLEISGRPVLTDLPKPWTLFGYQCQGNNLKILCFGKGTGAGEKFCAYSIDRPLAMAQDDQSLIQAWLDINENKVRYASVSDDFLISRSIITLGIHPVQQITVESTLAIAKTIWIYDPHNPGWHIVIAPTPLQIKSELKQFQGLMEQAHYNYDNPCYSGLKEETPRIVSRIIPKRPKKESWLEALKEWIRREART